MGSGKRITSLTEETSVLPTDQIAIDRDGYTFAKKATVSDLISSGCLITNATVITNITNEANWVNQLYVGSVVGLSSCNYYVDMVLRIKYEFDGTNLIRYSINNIL